MVPRAREDRLVVQELPDEVLVYDLNRHKAHCLNRTAAFIWRHCDGRTSVAKLATLLRKELKSPVDEAVVWLALDHLGRAHLLGERVMPPAGAPRLSRREVMRKLALAGALSVLLPAVTSIVAPTATEAASGCLKTTCESGKTSSCNGCAGLACTDDPKGCTTKCKKCKWISGSKVCDCA
jgi:hypothetical protein